MGHSTRGAEELIGMLQAFGIEVVADVRRYPASRRFPHFNGPELRSCLLAERIEYLECRGLGGRRKPRADSINSLWRNDSFRGYADYMQTPEFETHMEQLLNVARHKRTAMMCAEALWWRCHRGLIADYLKVRDVQVMHISAKGKAEPHPYTSAARIVEGKLSYEAPQEQSEQGSLWQDADASVKEQTSVKEQI